MLNPARLVFIDETAASTKMVRLNGRCPRGVRLIGHAPHGHWKTITFVAGLRNDGMVAPFVFDGPMNGPTFVTYIQQCLAPTLARRDTVIISGDAPPSGVLGILTRVQLATPQRSLLGSRGTSTSSIDTKN
jgi:hypothetical protein